MRKGTFDKDDARRLLDAVQQAISQRNWHLPVALAVADTHGDILVAQNMVGAKDGLPTAIDRAARAADPNRGQACKLTAVDGIRVVLIAPLCQPVAPSNPHDSWQGRVTVFDRDNAIVAGIGFATQRSAPVSSELVYRLDLTSDRNVRAQLAALVRVADKFFTKLPAPPPEETPTENPPTSRRTRRGTRGQGRPRRQPKPQSSEFDRLIGLTGRVERESRGRRHTGDIGQLITDEFRLFMQGRESLKDNPEDEPW